MIAGHFHHRPFLGRPRGICFPRGRHAVRRGIAGAFGGVMAIVLLAAHVCGMPTVAAGRIENDGVFYAWWRIERAERIDGGKVAQELALIFPAQSLKAYSVRCFVRQTPLAAYDRESESDKEFWLEAEVSTGVPPMIRVEARNACRTTVWARIEGAGKVFWAQTAFNQYGRSEGGELPANVSPSEPLPEFGFESSGESYWPQTGHTFSLTPEWEGKENIAEMEIRDANGILLEREAFDSGTARYTSPQDPELERAGDAAAKHLIFIVGDGLGNNHSFSLAVHRSRFGRLDLPSGLAVAAAAMAASLLFVLWHRRRGG